MAIWNPFAKKKTPEESLAAGDFRSALQGFMAVLKGKGNDPALMLQIAGCHLKLNEKDKAREFFIKVGEYYGDLGFFNKSVAAFKKALNITPGDKEILAKLAGYNDKVPKFMISDHFLKQAHGAGGAEPEMQASSPAPATLDPLPSSAYQTQPMDEEPEAASPPAQRLPDLPDFMAYTPKQATPAPLADKAAESDESEEVEIHHLESEEELAPSSKPPEKTGTKVKKTEKIVFSTRAVAHPPKQEASFDFNSLDDALDSLFAGPATPPPKPEPEPEPQPVEDDEPELEMIDTDMTLDTEMDQRHWALFRTMPKDVFMDFVVALENRDYDAQNYVVRKGETGTEMYLIADGEVEVLADIEGTMTRVAVLHEGDFFGEASLLTGQPRNADVRAISCTSCLLLTRGDLDRLSIAHPSVMASIKSIYYTRLRQNASRRK